MMKDQQGVPYVKPEAACGLVAAVEAELGLVTVGGDTTTRHGSDLIGETRDLVAAVTSFGVVHRKKRMPRLRRSSTRKLLSFAPSSSQLPPSPPHSLPTLPARKAAETHLPVLESKEGIFISMDDLDGLHVWSFKYRYWPNNNSRMYVLENTGDFVNTHGLQLGDYIMIYQDDQNQNYVIRAKKASDDDHEDVFADHMITSRNNGVNENYMVLNDYEPSKQGGSFYVNYPTVDDTNMSFIYDTTSFSNDSPLDFLGGSSTNYSRIGSLEGFGSVENFSLDDFY
ncbi:B3 domain-containing transcription factor FUS3-like isoform X2 [Juglans microcarpa x Juglans regia]|uniref:B3 domain-containing transcription factor FUS3-like isoform X2 n=1 Tax=Juglans microcarpa x Juglans regia TaxID=2249226 RepID=UPI001B7EB55D|nr:B3 domain-containing transcription factor FUS3-like isoform X2 [Juglans microcarpa x Juglans regia]